MVFGDNEIGTQVGLGNLAERDLLYGAVRQRPDGLRYTGWIRANRDC